MAKEGTIEMEGTVIKVKPQTKFDVKLNDNGVVIDCVLSGRLRTNKIRILNGDNVTVEISPYDLTKGRIIWREK